MGKTKVKIFASEDEQMLADLVNEDLELDPFREIISMQYSTASRSSIGAYEERIIVYSIAVFYKEK